MLPGSFAEIVKKSSPAVVQVSVVKTKDDSSQSPSPFGGKDDPFNQAFKNFYGDQVPKNYKQRGIGTGFIIGKEGFILTNNHIVEGAEGITITLWDKTEYKARILCLDSKTDLALIKIDGAKNLTNLTLGDSDKVEVGDWVVTIGNPFGLFNTFTAGTVGAKHRRLGNISYEDYLQINVNMNQGNDGGPLLNLDGEVIGINCMLFSMTGGSEGIGFAIPINMVKDLLPQLMMGKVVRGWLGVAIQTITPELQTKLGLKDTNGALVSDVVKGGPAEKAGIKTGDVIVSFDGKNIKDAKDLPFIVSTTSDGKNVKVEVFRNDDKKTFDIKVEELKEESEKSSNKKG
jgi:serine protease Do